MPRWHRRPHRHPPSYPPTPSPLPSSAFSLQLRRFPQQGHGTGPGRAGPGPGSKATGTADNRERLGRPTPTPYPGPVAWHSRESLLCSLPPAAVWHSLAQELQGEDDHEDIGPAQLGIPRQLQLTHPIQGAQPPVASRIGAVRVCGGRGSAGVRVYLGWGLTRVRVLSGVRVGGQLNWQLGGILRLSLGSGLKSGLGCTVGIQQGSWFSGGIRVRSELGLSLGSAGI